MIREAFEFVTLLGSKRWTPARLQAYREGRIRILIAHAYRNIPYYRRLMERHGLRPEEFYSLQDLARFPLTTKQDLRTAGTDCIDPRHRDLFRIATSGSSGDPFEVSLTHAEYRRRRLREFRALLGVGLGPRDRFVLLGPMRIRPRRLHRMLGLYRLEVIPYWDHPLDQARMIERYRPDVLWIYPTVLKQVLSHAGIRLSDLARPLLLITSSQVMDTPFRHQLLADLPALHVADFYGAAETGRIAAACRQYDGLHLENDAVIVEPLENGAPVPDGVEGSVAVTCLDQFAMPFIRYDLGDRCRLRLSSCPCGSSAPLIDAPAGRDADMITLPSGKRLSALTLDAAIRDISGLIQYRFIQERADRLTTQFCFQTDAAPELLREIEARLRKALLEPMEIKTELFGIGELHGPKFKSVVSRIK
jgi:phenylacetate-CoA ligase